MTENTLTETDDLDGMDEDERAAWAFRALGTNLRAAAEGVAAGNPEAVIAAFLAAAETAEFIGAEIDAACAVTEEETTDAGRDD